MSAQTIQLLKSRLRKAMAGKRAALPYGDARQKSLLAQRNMLQSGQWRLASSVALYASMKKEAATDLLLAAAWADGKEVWLPAITDRRAREMRFFPCPGPDFLLPGAFGISEPVRPGGLAPAFAPELMVLPGLAFDRLGNRLGYGGGYYDRFFAAFPNMTAKLVGLCFAFQIVARAPHDLMDSPVNGLCSEEGLLWI